MPIYEYKCSLCGKKFEKIEKFSDSPLEIHEECGGPVERLLSAPTLQFKGTGWYVTDYGKSNGRPAGKNGSDSHKESSSEAKSDTAKSSESTSTPSTSTTTTSSTADKK